MGFLFGSVRTIIINHFLISCFSCTSHCLLGMHNKLQQLSSLVVSLSHPFHQCCIYLSCTTNKAYYVCGYYPSHIRPSLQTNNTPSPHPSWYDLADCLCRRRAQDSIHIVRSVDSQWYIQHLPIPQSHHCIANHCCLSHSAAVVCSIAVALLQVNANHWISNLTWRCPIPNLGKGVDNNHRSMTLMYVYFTSRWRYMSEWGEHV